MKKIIALHHWLGTFFCFLFLIWFLSGFVMMYKGFPSLTNTERIHLNKSANLDEKSILNPAVIFKNDEVDEIYSLRLNYQLNQPVYQLTKSNGEITSRLAHSGDKVSVGIKEAELIAKSAVDLQCNATVECLNSLDQWIPRTKFLKHLPIYKAAFEDKEKTWIYVSSKTGELINMNTRSERLWAWLGAIPHWIYFKDIRVHNTFWSLLIQFLAGLGFIMTVTGIITGIVRYKKKPKAKFKRFKNKWYNFHYYLGLLFGLFICTWIFSGFMSMTPFDWTPSTQLNKNEDLIWKSNKFKLEDFSPVVWNKFLTETKFHTFKELEFTKFNNEIFLNFYTSKEKKVVGLDETIPDPTRNSYENKITSFNSLNPVKSAVIIDEYDDYYYDRKNNKTLPVLKMETADKLTYYIDLKSHEVVFKCAPENKINRWLYNGMHSLDFKFLTANRPLWDITVIFLLIGGTIVSFTGMGLGIKFIRRKKKKRTKNRKTEKQRKAKKR